MAKNKSRKLQPVVLAEDVDTLERLKKVDGYAPANPAYSLEAFTKAVGDLRAAEADEEQAATIHEQKRAVTIQRHWTVHDIAVGVKDSVEVQYGKNSVEVQMIGRKTEAERKSPGPRNKKNGQK